MLDIENKAVYDEIITGIEYHTHKPYASTTYKNNDEIRIPISQQDIITVPYESYLFIAGKCTGKKLDGTDAPVKFVNNAIAFLFDDIRYEISGIEVDKIKNLGITTTMKNLLSIQPNEVNSLKNACWLGPGSTQEAGDFSFSIPLRTLLGFAEDYKRIIVNVKQELILLRSSTDKNAVIGDTALNDVSVTIDRVYWRVPHVNVEDRYKLKLLKMVEKDTRIDMPFRSWELHEYPSLPITQTHSWTIKTSNQLERPRYAILAFQTDRKNNLKKNMSSFDHCDLQNIKLYLNSQYFPYDNIHGDMTLFYEMFFRFQNSYYGRSCSPIMDIDKFKSECPLYVIDCSKQNDLLKIGAVDVRLEFQLKSNVPANTTAYCLLLHDCHMTYSLLTGSVSKVTI
jgi:hypothetical protein